MRVPKRPSVFRFKNEKEKTSLIYLNHSLSKIKMEMKSKIEVTVNNFLDHKLIQESSRMLYLYIYIYIYIYIFIYILLLLLILLISLLFMLYQLCTKYNTIIQYNTI